MTRLNLAALPFVAVVLVALPIAGCSDQETDSGNGYVPKVMQDTDNDGIPDKCEWFFGTDPNKTDTDNDALADGSEDADGDGYTNYQEMKPYADKDMCPPVPDGGLEAAADVVTQDASEDAGGDAAEDAAEDGSAGDAAATDAEGDAASETGGEDASDAEATDAATE